MSTIGSDVIRAPIIHHYDGGDKQGFKRLCAVYKEHLEKCPGKKFKLISTETQATSPNIVYNVCPKLCQKVSDIVHKESNVFKYKESNVFGYVRLSRVVLKKLQCNEFNWLKAKLLAQLFKSSGSVFFYADTKSTAIAAVHIDVSLTILGKPEWEEPMKEGKLQAKRRASQVTDFPTKTLYYYDEDRFKNLCALYGEHIAKYPKVPFILIRRTFQAAHKNKVYNLCPLLWCTIDELIYKPATVLGYVPLSKKFLRCQKDCTEEDRIKAALLLPLFKECQSGVPLSFVRYYPTTKGEAIAAACIDNTAVMIFGRPEWGAPLKTDKLETKRKEEDLIRPLRVYKCDEDNLEGLRAAYLQHLGEFPNTPFELVSSEKDATNPDIVYNICPKLYENLGLKFTDPSERVIEVFEKQRLS